MNDAYVHFHEIINQLIPKNKIWYLTYAKHLNVLYFQRYLKKMYYVSFFIQ